MKRVLVILLLSVFLVSALCACGTAPASDDDGDTLTVAASTYPIALLAEAVTEGADGVTVKAVVNQQISCVHDYTLTTTDMQTIESADILLLNGAGLDDFMGDVLAVYDGTTADCSENVPLLTMTEGDEAGEPDPHIWMDPARAAIMAQNIAAVLSEADPDNADLYRQNAENAAAELTALRDELNAEVCGNDAYCQELITFHDGFGYFADALGLTILRAIEEEAGSEASAQDIAMIIDLIRAHQLPVIFGEVNGSHSTAEAIARETGVAVHDLTLIMNGDVSDGLAGYESALRANVEALKIPEGGAA